MVASISTQTITATWTPSSYSSGIFSALAGLFGTAYDTYSASGVTYHVYSYQYSTYTKGTAYLVVGINSTNNYTYWQLFDNWSTSSHSGTNGSYQCSFTSLPSTSSNITLSIITDTEFRAVFLQQSGWTLTNTCIGLYRPSTISPSWNENSYLCAFLTGSNYPFTPLFYPSGTNPFGTSNGNTPIYFQTENSAAVCSFQSPNTTLNSGVVDVMASPVLLSPTAGAGTPYGAIGISSSLGFAGGSSPSIGDIWTNGTIGYTLFYTAAKPYWGIRTT